MMEDRATSHKKYSWDKLIRTLTFWFLAGWLAILLSSCNPRYPEPSFENVPAVMAQSPCVAGVCVGDVGRQAVLSELARNELISSVSDNGEFAIEGGGAGTVEFAGIQPGSRDVVERIVLYLNGMLLGNVLRALGEPDELFLMFGCGHGVYVNSWLFYPEEGIEVQVQFPSRMRDRSSPVVLDDETPVLDVRYFDPVSYDKQFLTIHKVLHSYFSIAPTVTPEMLASAVRPWPGLGAPVQPFDLCPR